MKRSILIVDDEEKILELLSDYFEEAGYHIRKAASIKEAVAQINQSRLPDALILDVMLPDGNGIELLKKLRSIERTKTLPVVVISAHYTEANHKVAAFKIGADDFLNKPFDLSELKSRVERLIPKNGNGMTPPPTEEAAKGSAEIASQIISDIFVKKETEKKEKAAGLTANTPKEPLAPQTKKGPIPFKELFSSFLELLLMPPLFFSPLRRHHLKPLTIACLGLFGLGYGLQAGTAAGSLGVGLTALIASSFGLTFFIGTIAWICHWFMGLKQKVLKTKDMFFALGLSCAPVAISSLLGFLYVLIGKGKAGDFNGSLLLLLPYQASSAVGFWLRRLDVFELWGLWTLSLALVAITGFKKKSARKRILIFWIGFVLVGSVLKGLFL